MARLDPNKLHTRFAKGVTPVRLSFPRCYTLTHSDATGDLFLTVAPDFERRQISGWYTRLMRDEVLAEWKQENDGALLRVHCHVSGGLVVGSAAYAMRFFSMSCRWCLKHFALATGACSRRTPSRTKRRSGYAFIPGSANTIAWKIGGIAPITRHRPQFGHVQAEMKAE
jgi:hypothetical protein